MYIPNLTPIFGVFKRQHENLLTFFVRSQGGSWKKLSLAEGMPIPQIRGQEILPPTFGILRSTLSPIPSCLRLERL